jgi:nitroreductase
MTDPLFEPYSGYRQYPIEEMQKRSKEFLEGIVRRRTVRDFSDKSVPKDIIENCIKAAGSSPSGANHQPWHFAVVTDPDTKTDIRKAAEEEERLLYNERAPNEWLEALAPLGTDENKPFLEIAPYLIVIFAESYSLDTDDNKIKNYYVSESVGIATGILITALHNAGLVTLTHTPSPLNFLRRILRRGKNERAFLILVTGFPAEDAKVPVLKKKNFEDYTSFI